MGLLLFAEEWIASDAAEAWMSFCDVSMHLQIGVCKGLTLTASEPALYWHLNLYSSPSFSRAFALILQLTVELLLFAEAWIAFKADDAWVALCY